MWIKPYLVQMCVVLLRSDRHFLSPGFLLLWIAYSYHSLCPLFPLEFLSFSQWYVRISFYVFDIDYLSGVNFVYGDLYWIEILDFDLVRPMHLFFPLWLWFPGLIQDILLYLKTYKVFAYIFIYMINILSFALRSLIHFEFSFVYGVI